MIKPSLIDCAFRVVYRCGFIAAQCWWFVRRPYHDGALVAMWAKDQFLVVRQSYQPLWTMPGGGVELAETPAAAATRELVEEVGLSISIAQLRSAGAVLRFFRWRHDRVHFFELDVDVKLPCALDNRELVECRWLTSDDALALPLVPHLRDYLIARADRIRPLERDAAFTQAQAN